MEWTLTKKNDHGEWVYFSEFGSLHQVEDYLDAMDPTASGKYRLESTPPAPMVLPFPVAHGDEGRADQ